MGPEKHRDKRLPFRETKGTGNIRKAVSLRVPFSRCDGAGGAASPQGVLVTCEPRGADAAVPVDSVHAGSVHARVTGAVVKIVFTVGTCRGNSGEKPRDVTAQTLPVSAGDARCRGRGGPGGDPGSGGHSGGSPDSSPPRAHGPDQRDSSARE